MKIVISFILFYLTSSFSKENITYKKCCFCISDGVEVHRKMCSTWQKKQKGCSINDDILLSVLQLNLFPKERPFQCEHVRIWGAFHAVNTMEYTELPFKISKSIAISTSAKKVCYDGFSCVIFDNIKDVKTCALGLADDKNIKDCRFYISGNQNIGITTTYTKTNFFNCNPISETIEGESTISRLTISVQSGIAKLSYGKCSKEGNFCAFTKNIDALKNSEDSPNKKYCSYQNTITTQPCCITKENKKIDNEDTFYGRWSLPGSGC
jgi:hypothetical protein